MSVSEPTTDRVASPIHQRIASLREELLGFLRRRTADPEEVAQDTWLKVAEAAPSCPDARSFRAFVYVVARRLLIDAARRRARRVVLVPLDGGGDAVERRMPDGRLVADQALEVVERTLEQMRPEISEVFRLRHTTDLTFEAIALRQGVGLNTALGRHHRATQLIAAALRAAGLLQE